MVEKDEIIVIAKKLCDKRIEKTNEDEFIEIVLTDVKILPITDVQFNEMCTIIGDPQDYENVVYMDLSEQCFMNMKEAIEYLENFINDSKEYDNDDPEVEKMKVFLDIILDYKDYSMIMLEDRKVYEDGESDTE